MNNVKCRRCDHAIKQIGRDIHVCINRLFIVTLDAQVVASGRTIDEALHDETNWTIDMRQSGLVPDVPSWTRP
jgi:hypothetical protein